MSFAREKRRLLGWLALGAPLPLPFNEVLEWPVLFLYLFLVAYFLRRAEDPTLAPLGNTQLNVFGALYIPVLALDLFAAAGRGQMVPVLLHMILFVLLVKLFAIRQEKDKWQVLLAIFFVFIAAMATSSHAAVAIYLLAALGAGLLVLARLAEWHTLAALARDESRLGPAPERSRALPPGGRSLAGAMGGVVLLAVPIFVGLPRVTEPFLVSRGGVGLSLNRVSGFTDDINLDGGGPIGTNREIALRVAYAAPVANPGNLRFKGSTFERYVNRRWIRDDAAFSLLRPSPEDPRHFDLAQPAEAGSAPAEGSERPPAPPVVARATLYLEPMPSGVVIVPTEATTLDFEVRPPRPFRDAGGGVFLSDRRLRQSALVYSVDLAAQPQVWARTEAEGAPSAALDPGGITPRIAALAREVAGEGGPQQKLERIERHLLENYGYTLDTTPPDGVDPIEYFLFDRRAGHCELFASAMVLMARSEGIPARFVSGFLGAEPNSLEDLHIVRQSNAHAWVEAYIQGSGWQVRDPTPPSGRPSISPQSLMLLLQQLYDYVIFRWDRYVLTYGASDQQSLRELVAGWLRGLAERWNALWADEPSPPADEATTVVPGAAVSVEASREAVEQSRRWLWLGLASVLAVAAGAAWRRWRRPATATALFARLRAVLEGPGFGVQASTPPLAVVEQLAGLLPAHRPQLDRLGALYLAESFDGRAVARPELQALERELPRALRRALKARRSGIDRT